MYGTGEWYTLAWYIVQGPMYGTGVVDPWYSVQGPMYDTGSGRPLNVQHWEW